MFAIEHGADVACRDRFAQFDQRFTEDELIPLAVLGHPVFGVRLRQIGQERETIGAEAAEVTRGGFARRFGGHRGDDIGQFERVNAEPLAQHAGDIAPQPGTIGFGQGNGVSIVNRRDRGFPA